ncbi:hypothetical protein [Brasilonema sp. UFV-L1]|uniref:hypothetical protein n=1 Tax=Brasilonema sp. UFV-L1 TaxID=2234130 RepID=UPI00145F088F|nr:hypothetical protein [Brasilonema sp. UFV-L1]NMG11111.1 hypothetical protein [Brasilonema sp. UFV-L1]
MNDYLSHLAARSLNLVPVLQPRLASLFESYTAVSENSIPLVETEFLTSEKQEEKTTEKKHSQLVLPKTEPKKYNNIPKKTETSISGEGENEEFSTSSIPTFSSPTPNTQSRKVPLSEIADNSPQSEMLLAKSRPNLQPSFLKFAQRDGESAQEGNPPPKPPYATSLLQENGETESLSPPLQTPLIKKSSIVVRPDKTLAGWREVSQASHQEHQSPNLTDDDTKIYASNMSTFYHPGSSGNTPSPPPTIQVTIGRIDVRAVTPPAPKQTTRTPPAPKLSLDDYLKSRKVGKI